MKAVTTALVLIAGAAVVLWYGNTLNSWVLGGLIGGLAALLLSIPISLTVFSYLSRRHDEHLRAEEQEEAAQVYMYEAQQASPRIGRGTYEVESYLSSKSQEEASWNGEEEAFFREKELKERELRRLPAPAPQRAPVAMQGQQARTTNHLPASRATQQLQPSKTMPLTRTKETMVLRATTQKMSYPGFPGYSAGSSLSQHRTDAIRVARREAAQQQQDDVEVLPSNMPRRVPSSRPTAALSHSTRQLPPLSQQSQQSSVVPQRPRRVIESSPSDARRALPAEGETVSSRRGEPQTDYVRNPAPSPQTESIRRSTQSGQAQRHPQTEYGFDSMQRTRSNMVTGSVQKPLVRRAPYMYEDDPLRQELAQRIDAPAVRRSSRYELIKDEDEENS